MQLTVIMGKGNRSSVDESKISDPEDETTVVEPDQGNGRTFENLPRREEG
jgi:hypothetical protein